jgi:hypothetical protein
MGASSDYITTGTETIRTTASEQLVAVARRVAPLVTGVAA